MPPPFPSRPLLIGEPLVASGEGVLFCGTPGEEELPGVLLPTGFNFGIDDNPSNRPPNFG